MNIRSKISGLFALGLTLVGTVFSLSNLTLAQDQPEQNEEPLEFTVSVPRSANQEPAAAITTLASAFRYDPIVDLQVRGLAEAQSDASIRGGTFDMTGINIGAASIYDPQSGHYTLDIPIPPSFLSPASVMTGAENAIAGFNSTAGTIFSGFAPAENWNIARIGIGDYRTNIQEVNTDSAKVLEGDLGDLAIGTSFGHTSTNGSRQFGDQDIYRYAARAQLSGNSSRQTDLLYTYQSKDFHWPNSYAPQELYGLTDLSTVESQSLDTALALLNHRAKLSSTANLEFTGYYKRNHNQYAVDDFNNDLFNSDRSTTKVFGGGLQGLKQFGATYVGLNTQVYGDNIKSNSLTFGNYDSRTLAKVSTYVGHKINLADGFVLDPNLGLSCDKSDRTAESIAPISKINLFKKHTLSESNFYAEYSGSSQLPGYAALNKDPETGLFRGNKSLKRQHSANSEVGYQYQREEFLLNSTLFYRKDDDLSDWTYSSTTQTFAEATAHNINVSTRGAELFAAIAKGYLTFANSYTLLDKDVNYGIGGDDSGFYTQNYPTQRTTSSLIAKPLEELEFRGDLEFRKQYQNVLRDSADTSYFISSVSVNYEVQEVTGLNLGLIVDNLGNEQFEEVPGVPGSGRLTSFIANYVW